MIYVDTGAFLARYLSKDQHHDRARNLWEKILRVGESCCTSNFVLDETLTFLARRSSYRFASERARQLYSSNELIILRPAVEDETESIALFEKYADQKVSFTDCISFVLMRKAGYRNRLFVRSSLPTSRFPSLVVNLIGVLAHRRESPLVIPN